MRQHRRYYYNTVHYNAVQLYIKQLACIAKTWVYIHICILYAHPAGCGEEEKFNNKDGGDGFYRKWNTRGKKQFRYSKLLKILSSIQP